MTTHSGTLAWRMPGTVEPGGLPSMGWHRVGHDWSDLAAAAAAAAALYATNPRHINNTDYRTHTTKEYWEHYSYSQDCSMYSSLVEVNTLLILCKVISSFININLFILIGG